MTEDNVQKENETRSNAPKIELPIWTANCSKTVQKIAIERRMQILNNLVKNVGIGGAMRRIKSLAELYKVGERVIYKDFTWIKGNFTPGDLKQVKMDVRIARDRALIEALKLMNDAETKEDRSKAILILMAVAQKYREEMEAWGEKEKVPDKVEVKGPIKLQLEIVDGRDNQDEVRTSDESTSQEH